MPNISVDTGSLQEQINQLKELIEKIGLVEDKTKMLQFITIEEFAKISGWGICAVQDLYNRDDFPSCDFGKRKVAEVSAVKHYFSVPRRK